jgi:NADPH:quinone reductase-like Zn-dependent oxidoreductase
MFRCLTGLFFASISCLAAAADSSPPGAAAPLTMKGISFNRYGTSAVLHYGDLPTPAPAPGELRIRVHAASVNPADWKSRAGKYANGPLAAAITPGFDVSGVVAAVGAGVTTFKPGDAVFAMLPLNHSGGYAQFATVAASLAATKPKADDHVHAAAVPLAALTAWQALFDAAKLQAGQSVLIHGASGGVGHFAVQFAKAKGAHVIATASQKNLDFLKSLGADQVVDYRATKFEDVVKGVDVVFDTVGGDTLQRSYGVVKPGGYLVSVVDPVDTAELAKRGIRGAHVVVAPNAGQLAQIAQLIDAGKVKPYVSETLALQDAARAQDLSESGRTRGKIVLVVP